METLLHRQLKKIFAGSSGQEEVPWGDYRIDAVRNGRLIEIQHSGLGAIQSKIQELCQQQAVDVVKPLITRKKILRLDEKGGNPVSSSWSPKRGRLIDLFAELVHFVKAFPHPQLRLIVAELEVEEVRYPGHGRRRRKRKNDYEVEQLRLTQLGTCHVFRSAKDLLKILNCELPADFDTDQLAKAIGCERHEAQQIAFCLRRTGAIQHVAKRANALVYRVAVGPPAVSQAQRLPV